MVKSKRKTWKKRQHIQKVKGRRFTDEIRNPDLEKVLVVPKDGGRKENLQKKRSTTKNIRHSEP